MCFEACPVGVRGIAGIVGDKRRSLRAGKWIPRPRPIADRWSLRVRPFHQPVDLSVPAVCLSKLVYYHRVAGGFDRAKFSGPAGRVFAAQFVKVDVRAGDDLAIGIMWSISQPTRQVV